MQQDHREKGKELFGYGQTIRATGNTQDLLIRFFPPLVMAFKGRGNRCLFKSLFGTFLQSRKALQRADNLQMKSERNDLLFVIYAIVPMFDKCAQGCRIKLVFDFEYPCSQTVGCVIFQDRYCCLT